MRASRILVVLLASAMFHFICCGNIAIAITLNFDDITTQEGKGRLQNYGGLTWEGDWQWWGPVTPPDMASSGKYVASARGKHNTVRFGEKVTFMGSQITCLNSKAVWRGYSDGALIYTSPEIRDGSGVIEVNWHNVDRVDLDISSYSEATIDDFRYQLIPDTIYGGGSGTSEDPFIIQTAEHLNSIGEHAEDWDKHFVLVEDIDLGNYTGTDFNIIGWYRGSDSKPFAGVFDGKGHSISNFTYSQTDRESYIGIFAHVGLTGQVKNLRLIDVDIEAKTTRAGALVSWNSGLVSFCSSTGRVFGSASSGGLVGINFGGHIIECFSSCNVSSGNGQGAGGLVGLNESGSSIRNCYATGNVTEGRLIGGIVGINAGTIANCYSTCRVNPTEEQTGGIAAKNYVVIVNSYWDMETSLLQTSDGGEGKSTSDMKSLTTYLGWGDGAWVLDEGKDYPRLAWEDTPGIIITDPIFFDGSGTAHDPYQIRTAEDIKLIGRLPNTWDKHFKLIADIDLEGYDATNFNLIGGEVGMPFSGVFDGCGHSISNFSYDRNKYESYIGLFRCVRGRDAVVRNLALVEPNLNSTKHPDIFRICVGSLCGEISDGATIQDCYVRGGTVRGDFSVGGIIGANTWVTHYPDIQILPGGSLRNCYSTAKVEGVKNFGGLVGNDVYHRNVDKYSGDYLSCFHNPALNEGLPAIGNRSDPNAIGVSAEEMLTMETFISAGWDFTNTWNIGENQIYPYLRTFPASDINKDNITNLLDLSIMAGQWLDEM